MKSFIIDSVDHNVIQKSLKDAYNMKTLFLGFLVAETWNVIHISRKLLPKIKSAFTKSKNVFFSNYTNFVRLELNFLGPKSHKNLKFHFSIINKNMQKLDFVDNSVIC